MVGVRIRLLVVLALAASMGCVRNSAKLAEHAYWIGLKPKAPTVEPDVVELHYIFVDRPAGDASINDTVWREADENAVPLDLKAALRQNGLRVGKLGATLSSEMLELLKASNATQEGRKHFTHSGGLAKVQTTGVQERMSLFTFDNGQTQGEEFADVQGYLELTPIIGAGSEVRVQLLPKLEFGPRQHKRVPAPDLTGWQVRNERDERLFPDLKSELKLVSGEYCLVGCWMDRKGTLGQQLFSATVNGQDRQVVLLIRAVRPSRDDLFTAGYDLDDFFLTPIRQAGASARSVARDTLATASRPITGAK